MISAWVMGWFAALKDYIIAGGLIAIGIYVALYWQHRFARIVGMMLLGAGIGWGCFAYGRTVGGAYCYRQWEAANVKAKHDAEARDAEMELLTRAMADKYEKDLASQAADLQEKVKQYEDATKNAATCRRATADDIRRLCNITGSTAAECKNTKRLRP
jgi:hypothetical protein